MTKIILACIGIALGGAVTAVSGLYGAKVGERALHLQDAPVVARVINQQKADAAQLDRILKGGSAVTP